ncbi:HAMP domain-containing sensor histidine kinase [Sphingomonas sp. KR1UV-12]|uniref:histidine kinase n=1 Tax=Sphingomonas aurea TaxID=3063994 RepID=A0ABT9EN98_9SPHN|nr:HAMP domain-containing sensor histidine kinase [Sphingomonas sp. KR1UV-12]MDP1028437.1 HAMP domain-containing sensor histidine kinase [Sphingomonas sp. KR1UV-12]
MNSSRGSILVGLCLVACGFAGGAAWRYGLWGLLTGALLVALWLGVLNWWAAVWPRPPVRMTAATVAAGELTAQRVLLDAAPTPMLGIEAGAARALNRAARRLFATDDRVLPLPPALADPAATHFAYEGSNWRLDRVMLPGAGRMVVALIDIAREERAAEARATAELIHVLGHELLNGLAPIVSLAESGLAAVERPDPDPALLREVLGTLARRAEGLQRFTEAYRALARLPEPALRPVPVAVLADDLARLFAGRFPHIALAVEVADVPPWPIDRDQLTQALWALLQNAAEADGATRVALAVRMTDGGLAIDVADDGAGIDADDAARIFRPFHTTKPEGTGVGLSLARQIAHAHGGTLTLEPGAGTMFRLLLPSVPV